MAGIDRYGSHAATLDAHTRNLYQLLKTGKYISSPYRAQFDFTEGLADANYLKAVPFLVPRPITLDRIAIYVTTAGGAGAEMRLGIYNDGVNLYPAGLLADYGTIDATTTGIKAIIINQALAKGMYWLACVCNDATVKIPMTYYHTSPLGYSDPRYNAGNCYISYTYGALPNPFPSGATEGGYLYLISVRIASLD